jgi:hypothetical protein
LRQPKIRKLVQTTSREKELKDHKSRLCKEAEEAADNLTL